MNALAAKMKTKNITGEWTEIADLLDFFRDVACSSLVECLYGPTMHRLNPDFMQTSGASTQVLRGLLGESPILLSPQHINLAKTVLISSKTGILTQENISTS
jgi:hypothetical protein